MTIYGSHDQFGWSFNLIFFGSKSGFEQQDIDYRNGYRYIKEFRTFPTAASPSRTNFTLLLGFGPDEGGGC